MGQPTLSNGFFSEVENMKFDLDKHKYIQYSNWEEQYSFKSDRTFIQELGQAKTGLQQQIEVNPINRNSRVATIL